MNHFAGLELELLQLLEEGNDSPLFFTFAYGGTQPLCVTLPPGLARLSIEAPNAAPVPVSLASLASPGKMVSVGSRELHLQFLRAENAICRGPLLVFEDGAPVPCFAAPRPWWRRLFGGKPKALLAVHLVGAGDEASRRREIEAGLNLALNLMKGRVRPGADDAGYFAGGHDGPLPPT